MEEKQDNSQRIKKYTNSLRILLEDDNIFSQKQLLDLQHKHELSSEDVDKVETIATTLFLNAKSAFDMGEWDKALTTIEEALFKSPINIEFLELYFNIVIESRKLLGKESKDQTNLDLITKRIQKISKKTYKRLVKEVKTDKKRFNKLWLLTILILFIPGFILLKKPTKKSTYLAPIIEQLEPGEIYTEIKIIKHQSQPKIELIESQINGDFNSFLYSLKFNISSNYENLLHIEGDMIWYDKIGNQILIKGFSSPKSTEYFLNEKIPISITTNSHRDTPTIDKVVINITSIQSSKGLDRGDLLPIDLILPKGINWKINIEQFEYLITEGVVSNYLSLGLVITNSDNRNIKELRGKIEWINDYGIVISSSNLTLISKKDLALDKNKRVIKKTIELSEISDKYRIIIEEIK